MRVRYAVELYGEAESLEKKKPERALRKYLEADDNLSAIGKDQLAGFLEKLDNNTKLVQRAEYVHDSTKGKIETLEGWLNRERRK